MKQLSFTRKCTHLSCIERIFKGKMCWIGEEIEIKNKKFMTWANITFPRFRVKK